MSFSIVSNAAALHAARASADTTAAIRTHVGKLASGTRLTSAKEDSASLAQASRLESEYRGMDRITYDLNRGYNMAAVAETAYAAIETTLQRARELAVQGATDTYDPSTRMMSYEFLAIESEWADIAKRANYADFSLLDSDVGDYEFKTGNGGSDSLTLTFRDNDTVFKTAFGTMQANLPTGAGSELQALIAKLDTAIDSVNSERAQMGSYMKRIEHKIAGMERNAIQVKRSYGITADVDFSTETTSMAREQILHQAANAMLAQANVAKDRVFGLLTA